jgi:hypothetical protein
LNRREVHGTIKALYPVKPLLLAAATLVVGGCVVHRMDLSPGSSPATTAGANARIAGRPALVTLHNEDGGIEQKAVESAQFEDDGSVALARAKSVENRSPTPGPTEEWTRVPRDTVVDVTTVDHKRATAKGFLYAAVGGFLTTTTVVSLVVASGMFCQEGPNDPTCYHPNAGGSLAAGSVAGLFVGFISGIVGAVIGAANADRTVIRVVPEAPREAASSGALP